MENTIDNTSTKVKCSLTSCYYNSSCCIAPCDLKMCTHCTKAEIDINVDQETGDLQCCQWCYGYKPVQCVNCQLQNNGEIVIPNMSDELDFLDEDFL